MDQIDKIFEELYETHYARLFGVVFTLSGRDEHLAKDLTQAVFVKLWQQLKSGRTYWDCFQSWSNTVIRNLWRDHLRRHDTWRVSKHGDDFEDIIEAEQANENEPSQEIEVVKIVEKAIGECTFGLAIHRQILSLLPTLHVHFDSPDADDFIANKLNKSPSYIKTQRPKAIGALKRCLRAKGIKLSDLI